jgi:glycosyltransferase involved in cell wall biosynthesis
MRAVSVAKSEATLKPLHVLHVLTLSGANGEYGGPNRVASEHCKTLQKRGHRAQIFTGVVSNSIPQRNEYLDESFELVQPLLKSFPVSSLWSNSLPRRLFKLVKGVDLVHIHFARDLIPILTALVCVLLRKPFVTQTHGMVIEDNRLIIKVFDFFFTRLALNKSSRNFFLSEQESSDLRHFHFKTQMELLPNGIEVLDGIDENTENKIPRVIFCSRLQARKRPDRFLNLARFASKNGLSANFVMFGSDGGELSTVLHEIRFDKTLSAVQYEGALPPNQVLDMLKRSDLLVLPSENEPFPMIVLEALSVGTPVLIMPSCGLASLVKTQYPEMIVPEENDVALISAFTSAYKRTLTTRDRESIRNFCMDTFSIEKVVDVLEFNYQTILDR